MAIDGTFVPDIRLVYSGEDPTGVLGVYYERIRETRHSLFLHLNLSPDQLLDCSLESVCLAVNDFIRVLGLFNGANIKGLLDRDSNLGSLLDVENFANLLAHQLSSINEMISQMGLTFEELMNRDVYKRDVIPYLTVAHSLIENFQDKYMESYLRIFETINGVREGIDSLLFILPLPFDSKV